MRTWVRILVAVIASSALLLIDLSDVSAAFIAQTGGWLLGTVAVYTTVYALLAPRILPKINPWAIASFIETVRISRAASSNLLSRDVCGTLRRNPGYPIPSWSCTSST